MGWAWLAGLLSEGLLLSGDEIMGEVSSGMKTEPEGSVTSLIRK